MPQDPQQLLQQLATSPQDALNSAVAPGGAPGGAEIEEWMARMPDQNDIEAFQLWQQEGIDRGFISPEPVASDIPAPTNPGPAGQLAGLLG